MEDWVRFGNWQFASDFRTASHTSEPRVIKFTRAERSLLEVLVRNEGTVLGRGRLLNAVSGIGSDDSDRKIDYIINRLRKKLNDSARRPRFISTEYGEGYRWVAERTVTERASSGSFIVVGPVNGLHFKGNMAQIGWSFTEELVQRINQCTGRNHTVKLDVDRPPIESFTGIPPQFVVGLDFINTGSDDLDCAVTLKQFRTGAILKVTRINVCDSGSITPPQQQLASRLATDIRDEIWQQLNRVNDSVVTPYGEPLAVRLHLAALLFSKGATAKEEIEHRIDMLMRDTPANSATILRQIHELTEQDLQAIEASERRLRIELRKHQGNHEAAIFLATTLHNRYILGGVDVIVAEDRRSRDIIEIERLVTSSLPYLKDKGILLLSAAKLLYFLHRGYEQTAMKLAETAFKTTTALATAFTTLGQLRMWEGMIDESVALYDRGLELAEPGSHFQRHLLELKCQALVADNDHDAEISTAADLFNSVRGYGPRLGGVHMALFYTTNEEHDQQVKLEAALDLMDENRARSVALFIHYINARLFKHETHRNNILRRPLSLLVDKFGLGVIPEEVRADAPLDLLSGPLVHR